jgi:MoxR-like ATPase
MSDNKTNVDLSKKDELIKQESAFVDLLSLEINKKIIGQKKMIERLMIGLLGRGHILLEGVPGLAKTLAINSLSRAVKGSFSRIQFTPDLLPADVVGTMIYNMKEGNFSIKQGPVFANFVLADEINRAPAKVQSALLEAMQEKQVTIGDKTFKLSDPFLVMATQNPVEQEGTYPLPEAQLDRFMFNLKIDYPSNEDEISIVRKTTTEEKEKINPVMTQIEITEYQNLVKRVPVSDNVVNYAVKIVSATRPSSSPLEFIKESVDWGAGPRASQFLVLAAKAKAILDGRPTPDIKDVQSLVAPILRHRVLPNFNAEAEGLKIEDILKKLLISIPE